MILSTFDMTFLVEFMVYGEYLNSHWNGCFCFGILEFKDFFRGAKDYG